MISTFPTKSSRLSLSTIAMSAMFLFGIMLARADILEMSYSGTFSTTLGVIHAGDTFSGEITWDSTPSVNACPGAVQYQICIPLITDVLNLPAGDGLSVPGATVTFQAIPEVIAGVLNFSTAVPQINVVSSIDGNTYSFFITPTSGSVAENFSNVETATGYTSSGPTAVPEPGSLSMAALALLLTAFRRREARKVYSRSCLPHA
jgi:hypothetical protein